MIYSKLPEDFSPLFEVTGCFVEAHGQIVLLHRQDGKSEGNKWGVPGGKVDKGEDIARAMIREIKEETGLDILPDYLRYLGHVYVRHLNYDFIYHTFHTELETKPSIIISKAEHKAFHWTAPHNALLMDLVLDEDECIKRFYGEQ